MAKTRGVLVLGLTAGRNIPIWETSLEKPINKEISIILELLFTLSSLKKKIKRFSRCSWIQHTTTSNKDWKKIQGNFWVKNQAKESVDHDCE